MDYEKKYNEAMLRADEAVQKGCLDKDMFNIIFPPEEIEDERIRKRLLWFLANYTGRWDYPETRMSCRAWLEKQKEQKPIQTDAEKEYVRTLKSLVADFVRANNYIERGYYQQIYDWLDGRHVEQKEQKPILEVFGFKVGDAVRLKDGDGRKHIIKSFEEVEGVHGPNFYHVEFEDNSARDGIYPGEEYPNGYYTQMEKFEEEQKPAWSEEDEKMRNIAIEWAETMSGQFGFVDMDPTIFRKITTWLKSLRPQPKPEWSEKDKVMFDTILNLLGYGYKESPNENIPTWSEIRTWLLSHLSQHHWKPSEDQMAWLKLAIDEAKEPLKSQLEELYKNIRENLIWK